MSINIEYKIIREIPKIKEIEVFQKKIWSGDTATPLHQLLTTIHNGGVIIGAYFQDLLVGFCYGFPGYQTGEIYLVSHMMGIDPEFRNQGIGFELKWRQKRWAEENGYRKIIWTFDPLESRNAYLNLNKLKGYIKTYLPSHYGEMTDEINKGLPSDRFLLEWDIGVEQFENKNSHANYQKIVDFEYEGSFIAPKMLEIEFTEHTYLVAIPLNIHDMKKENMPLAAKWRFALRDIFTQLFAKDYVAVEIMKGNDGEPVQYYVVTRDVN